MFFVVALLFKKMYSFPLHNFNINLPHLVLLQSPRFSLHHHLKIQSYYCCYVIVAGSHTYGSIGAAVPGPTPHTIITINPNPAETIFLVGGCPACRVNDLEKNKNNITITMLMTFFFFSLLGWCSWWWIHFSWIAMCSCLFPYWNPVLSSA